MVALNVEHHALAHQLIQRVGFQFRWMKSTNILLQVLHNGIDLILAQGCLRPVIREQLDKSLFHESPMLFVIKHFKLVNNLVLDDLLDDVLQSDNADDSMSWITTILNFNLSYNTDMCETFLKVAKEWLEFIVS